MRHSCIREPTLPLGRSSGRRGRLSLNRVSASVHASRECSLKGVDTLLVHGLCLCFFLLLLLCGGLRCLLLGCFVGSSLLCSADHSSSSCSCRRSCACVVVGNRSYRGASSSASGRTLYTTSFRLLGIIRGCLLFCFLLFLGLGCWRWGLGVDSRLLFC